MSEEKQEDIALIGAKSESVTEESERESVHMATIPEKESPEKDISLAGSVGQEYATSVAGAKDSPSLSMTAQRRRRFVRLDTTIDRNSPENSPTSSMSQSVFGGLFNVDPKDDGFHQIGRTVINPLGFHSSHTQFTQPINSSKSIKTGRFFVSPAQSIQMPLSKRTPTNSESSAAPSTALPEGRDEREPSMLFAMSDISLVRNQEQVSERQDETLIKELEQQPLIDNFMEVIPLNPADENEQQGFNLDQFIREVDENQTTVHSHFSVNTQDSAIYEHAPLQCGNIRFVKESNELPYEPKKHYMCVGSDTNMQDVTDFMSKYWGMRNPKIVLSVISAEEQYKPWRSQRLNDDFQKGIIKAANTTDIWIITTGIDAGIPKVIGEAIKEYNIKLQNSRLIYNQLLTSSELRQRRPKVIGIVPKDLVQYGVYLDGTEGVQIRNIGQKPSANIYELNPDHTYFIIADEENQDARLTSLRCAIENQFRNKSACRRHTVQRLMSLGSDSEQACSQEETGLPENQENFIPVVGLLVQGAPSNVDHILYYLQNKMPIVVLKGSGGIADIIGYAYEELQEKAESDPDYEENFLKPELIKMIIRAFGSNFYNNDLAKFTLRDKIIQCVKSANEGEGDSTYITVVNIKGWGSSMKDLDKYILMALFRSEKKVGVASLDQLQNNLQLIIDWNRPDLALEIFQQDFVKVRIDKKMFEKALVQKDREEFIDLFLTQGVRVHKFLNHKKYKLLFEKAEDREFFLNVCIGAVLGINMMPDRPIGDLFLKDNLNRLIYKLSWVRNFVDPYELSMNAKGMSSSDGAVAERKAINCLVLWAVLMGRHKLAQTLCNHCDEPIGVALICSRIYKELSKYNMEQYQKTELEDKAKEFGEMALGALAICWRDNSSQAYHMLGRRLPDFNNKTVIEIAHDAGYIHFLAHPCCQKWLTKKFLGNLQIKELDWGFGRLPYWFKILTSVFLIFPMFIWITFIPPSRKKVPGPEADETNSLQEDEEDDDEDEEIVILTKSTFDKLNKKDKAPFGNKLRSVLSRSKKSSHLPFYVKYYLLWTAPITKFWTTQVFYFAFLGVFSLATIWPTCGNQYLDMVVWLWAMTIELELVWRVYRKYHRYKTLSLVGNYVDILLIMAFLIILLLTRIMHVWVGLSDYMQARTFMCYGLIYFFYRLLGVYLPISPTLGPMLLRMSRMVNHDFVAFVRMFLIFLIVGGVTIQAVLYPHWPLGVELVKRIITRPMYAMFITQVDDLDGAECSKGYSNSTDMCYTGAGMYSADANTNLVQDLEKCPRTSLSGYVITLQYLMICKLVLVTLLFAMFSLTIAKVDIVASDIWKFQRYALIADFIERFSLPPPFTFLSMLVLIAKKLVKYCRKKCRHCCVRKPKLLSMKSRSGDMQVDDKLFWKKVAREYKATEEAKLEKDSIRTKQGDILIGLQEDLMSYRKSMKRLNDRIMELERMVSTSHVCLEDIAHKLEKSGTEYTWGIGGMREVSTSHVCLEDIAHKLEKSGTEYTWGIGGMREVSTSHVCLEDIAHKLEKSEVQGITHVKDRFIHVVARQSPYPSTCIARFPVFDKYLHWETAYSVYDPKTYTLEKSKFPDHERDFVDEDMIEIKKKVEGGLEDGAQMTPVADFGPKWNTVVTYMERDQRREIDRRSWITMDNKPLRYVLDSLSLPQNPMGRTGLRGKGILWRWGPNHMIKAVVTRWRRKCGPNPGTEYLCVEGKRVLEFITVHKDSFTDTSFTLPGEILHGLSNLYSILCHAFMTQVFNVEESVSRYDKFDQRDMIQFFSQFACALADGSTGPVSPQDMPVLAQVPSPSHRADHNSHTNLRSEVDSKGFCASMLYTGYLDDPRNTDNAWVEAEVWNFHFDVGDTFDLTFSQDLSVNWKEVSPYVKMYGNEDVIIQEAARIHDAYH
ncbi:transient receptor potential cation channel subfamily M member-like 2 isoform X2 [Dreissena polymorpha]|uniref:transient receptor potential cation channel subfamily M member-like 2 isoform X2 n=1 Tax=Dreissena polymorpha TaxID=45954 RepID=UPI0022645641|nr:transient receptor potential cation channel subfamily M member-like 2 isoform X2 [Dreissena polymorpha]